MKSNREAKNLILRNSFITFCRLLFPAEEWRTQLMALHKPGALMELPQQENLLALILMLPCFPVFGQLSTPDSGW